MKDIVEYKGIKIGDKILIPDGMWEEYYDDNIAEVTDFSPEHDIVHWKKKCKFGGTGHSGWYYNEIKLISTCDRVARWSSAKALTEVRTLSCALKTNNMKELQCNTDQVPRKWYNSHTFPLIPVITSKEGDDHNTSSWSFNWLFIRLWTLDAFEFEIGIVIDTHWGIGVIGILPYLRWVIAIPAPQRLQIWTQSNLWRKPKKFNSN